jgi:hypothetical protein
MACGHLQGDGGVRPRGFTIGSDSATIVAQLPDPSLRIPCPPACFYAIAHCHLGKGDVQPDNVVVRKAPPWRFPMAFSDDGGSSLSTLVMRRCTLPANRVGDEPASRNRPNSDTAGGTPNDGASGQLHRGPPPACGSGWARCDRLPRRAVLHLATEGVMSIDSLDAEVRSRFQQNGVA